MLDGRVLGASQVEYKPFGKPPLKREASYPFASGPMRLASERVIRSMENAWFEKDGMPLFTPLGVGPWIAKRRFSTA